MTLKLISHPMRFKEGTRCVFMKGRRKDDGDPSRYFARVTHDEREFDAAIMELLRLAAPTDRIYASLCARDVMKAARAFNHRRVDAAYDSDPETFYRKMDSHWISCLMQPANGAERLWLFDCDSIAEYESMVLELGSVTEILLEYGTPNGRHIITRPFNRSVLSDDNALMLWMHP